jgi:hypothetical protein
MINTTFTISILSKLILFLLIGLSYGEYDKGFKPGRSNLRGMILRNPEYSEEHKRRILQSRPEEDVAYPSLRYTDFDDLTSTAKRHAAYLGYWSTAWNEPGTNSIERLRFDNALISRNETTQLGFPALFESFGYFGLDEDVWDCWVNHYSGYTWSWYSRYNYNWTLLALGWNEIAWDSNNATLAPKSESKKWNDLTDKEKLAAEELCYTQEMWDDIAIDQWVPSEP